MFGKKIGKLIPVRIRIPWWRGKSTRTPRDPSVAVSPAPDQQLSTVVSASETSHNLSFHNVSDVTQITLFVVQAVAGGIPVVGAPLKMAIGGLIASLQMIDNYIQNREDLDGLTRRLRQALIKMLGDTANKLKKLQNGFFVSARLTKEIAACSGKINDHLLEFTAFSAMRTENSIDHVVVLLETQSTQIQSITQFTATVGPGHLPRAMTTGCVIVVDATGLEHNMLLDQCSSFDQLLAFLPGIIKQCPLENRPIQQWYIDRGQYDFVIDNGTNITQLTRECDIWSTIQPGTKIVMRVIITEVSRTKSATHQCCCGAWNNYEVEQALAQCYIITCYHCQRRYQFTLIEEGEATSRQGERSQFGDDGLVRDEKSLIRNFLMKEVVCGTRVYSCIHDFTDISNSGKYSCPRKLYR
ncbi:hypothetical protein EDC04DRAFT_546875 [Pisolithus marmoratus]|nr:hypothetical protein EDC04DRAFT_546875 [Pisolithus marmoratus]